MSSCVVIALNLIYRYSCRCLINLLPVATCWMPPMTCTGPSCDTSPHRSSPNNGRSAGGVGVEACGLVVEVGLELFVRLIVWLEACPPSVRVLSRGEPGPHCSRRTCLVVS